MIQSWLIHGGCGSFMEDMTIWRADYKVIFRFLHRVGVRAPFPPSPTLFKSQLYTGKHLGSLHLWSLLPGNFSYSPGPHLFIVVTPTHPSLRFQLKCHFSREVIPDCRPAPRPGQVPCYHFIPFEFVLVDLFSYCT